MRVYDFVCCVLLVVGLVFASTTSVLASSATKTPTVPTIPTGGPTKAPTTPTAPTTLSPTNSPTVTPYNITVTHYARNTNCAGNPVARQIYSAPTLELQCNTAPRVAFLGNANAVAWQGQCYTVPGIGDLPNTQALDMRLWFKSPSCPAYANAQSEIPGQIKVGESNQICFQNIFPSTDIKVAHDCNNRFGSAGSLCGFEHVETIAAAGVLAAGALLM